MTSEREHLDQMAHELRADLRVVGHRLWRRLGQGEALAEIVRRHPLVSAGGGIGAGILGLALVRAAIRHPRMVWRGARTLLKTITSNALTPLVVMARGRAAAAATGATDGVTGVRDANAAKEASLPR